MNNDEILLETLKKENEIIKRNCQKLSEEVEHKNAEMLEYKKKYENLSIETQKIQQELDSITYSRSYKLIKKIKKIFRR